MSEKSRSSWGAVAAAAVAGGGAGMGVDVPEPSSPCIESVRETQKIERETLDTHEVDGDLLLFLLLLQVAEHGLELVVLLRAVCSTVAAKGDPTLLLLLLRLLVHGLCAQIDGIAVERVVVDGLGRRCGRVCVSSEGVLREHDLLFLALLERGVEQGFCHVVVVVVVVVVVARERRARRRARSCCFIDSTWIRSPLS